MLAEFANNVLHSMFKPLLLFFYAGFLIPLFRVKLEFPKPVYQGLVIYLLLAIGWKGGEELASLEPHEIPQAVGFMVIGFITNFCIGMLCYGILRAATKLRKVDAATVAGFYGSDSAGTFVTAVGALTAAHIAYAPYMPVMLAVMEIPGCLVALLLVSKMREQGMDKNGNCPGEIGYNPAAKAKHVAIAHEHGEEVVEWDEEAEEQFATAGSKSTRTLARRSSVGTGDGGFDDNESWKGDESAEELHEAEVINAQLGLTSTKDIGSVKKKSWIQPTLLHEVFLNPGIFLLFAGIAIGFIGGLQGPKVVEQGNVLFINLFQGVLCLFLLEMGMTASSKLKDLRAAGPAYIAFGLLAPNVFAGIGLVVTHVYSLFLGHPFEPGTYVIFAVLCGAASYIAMPAVQRLAIPEASPTLPLAASLGLTFSYNVTIGIPVYLMIANYLTTQFPIQSM